MGKPEGYIDVAARIVEFREKYPDGCLRPANLDRPYDIVTADGKTFVVVVAAAHRTPDDPTPGIGMAWEPFPGPTNFTRDSELQNAETSAWGRALVAVLAADTKQGVASADEVRARQPQPETPALTQMQQSVKDALGELAEEEVEKVKARWEELGYERRFSALSDDQAGELLSAIDAVKSEVPF